jgi:hypothetical protein
LAVRLGSKGNRLSTRVRLTQTMDLCQADLRCLDAHAHLGNFTFESLPKAAIRHFAAGLRIPREYDFAIPHLVIKR